jgi:galactokinase
MIKQHDPEPLARVIIDAREHLHLTGSILASWAPGRVNLIGEHTDYNDGWVLPITIARHMTFAGQINEDPNDMTIRLYSSRYRKMATFSADRLGDPQDIPAWARYIAGSVGELRSMNVPICGFAAAFDGDIPIGGGMSSSAAFLIAVLSWFSHSLNLNFSPLDLARIAQRAETRGTGVRVGILDQASSVLGKPGHAVLLDCRTMEYEYIPFQLTQVRFLLCDTGVERSLETSKYNERRSECEMGVKALAVALHQEGDARQIHALRDVTERDLLRLGAHIPEPARQRTRHVITENQRTLTAAKALQEGNARLFGELLLQSHASLRDDYAVSCPELDAVVEIATSVPGSLGARLVGAGFGGAALIAVESSAADTVISTLQEQYPSRTERLPTIFEATPDGGPGTKVIPAP